MSIPPPGKILTLEFIKQNYKQLRDLLIEHEKKEKLKSRRLKVNMVTRYDIPKRKWPEPQE
jgi:hypothetical protein